MLRERLGSRGGYVEGITIHVDNIRKWTPPSQFSPLSEEAKGSLAILSSGSTTCRSRESAERQARQSSAHSAQLDRRHDRRQIVAEFVESVTAAPEKPILCSFAEPRLLNRAWSRDDSGESFLAGHFLKVNLHCTQKTQ
jgi:hypothetical protein